ncbi:MAG TPA: 3-oxoacyl-ACP synthase [Peptococcaceae bacterium]|nr:MAG: 3-oxoacyl-[acyl-carrier-protein] synthase 3 [Clostridia bacterium 41_269]HBT20030.1 3-oxoacyl-ACP synthase [Peptococcaceae bacterium]
MSSALRTRPVGILGTGICLPEKVLTNKDLEKMVDTSDEWIRTRTGIVERRIADPDTPTSVLAEKAARMALKNARIKAEDIGLIIVATVTPDMIFPATACLVQNRLGAISAAAFDLEAGCSGFIYGLVSGAQFVASGVYDYVLVIGAETLSRIVNWEDRNTCVLFGDGAGAVVIGPVPNGYGLLGIDLGSDGSGADLLDVPGGGSLNPATKYTVENKMHFLRMNGNEVFKFAVRIIGDSSIRALMSAGLKKEEIDFLIPHQANIRIIQAAVKRLKLSNDKVYVNLDRYGNTSAASVPIALHEAYEEGLIKKDSIIVLVAFGAGLTWGAAVIRWYE